MGWRWGLLAMLSLEIFIRLMAGHAGDEARQPCFGSHSSIHLFPFGSSWAVGAYVAEIRFVHQRGVLYTDQIPLVVSSCWHILCIRANRRACLSICGF